MKHKDQKNKFAVAVILAMFVSGFLVAQDYSQSDQMRFGIQMEPGNFLYVDDDNKTGPWNGTLENPYENIPEALDVATAGNTVVVLPGSYPVEENIAIQADIQMFLYPGDTLLFSENTTLSISGVIKAFGTATDSIFFTSAMAGNTWNGLEFANSQPGSELHFCALANTTGTNGGAVHISNSSPCFSNCLFENNNSTFGGGIYCGNMASALVSKCVFRNNGAGNSGGAICAAQADSLVIEQTAFCQNSAASNGGAVMLDDMRAFIRDCSFTDNQAGNGGAAYFDDVTATEGDFNLNNFKSNTASNNGGAVYIAQTGNFDCSKNIMIENSAENGAGVYLDNCEVTFLKNTVYGNSANTAGGGLYAINGNNQVKNNIFWANTASGDPQIGGTGLNVTYNDVEGDFAGVGNFSAEPLFAGIDNDDFHLTVWSPCINTGDTLSPPDPDSTVADLGAFYFHHLLPEIVMQPEDENVEKNEGAHFEVFASTAMTFQWQESTDGGVTWNSLNDTGIYSGTDSRELLISQAGLNMNGNYYRCIIQGIGPPDLITRHAYLNVYTTVSIAAGSETLCPGQFEIPVTTQDFFRVSAMSLTLQYDPTLLEYTGYSDFHEDLADHLYSINADDGNIYLSWAAADTVSIGSDLIISFLFNSLQHGSSNMIWDTITPGNCELTHLDGHVLRDNYYNGSVVVHQLVDITGQPASTTVNFGQNAFFGISAVGSGLNYQWQESTDGGGSWTNLTNSALYSGTASNELSIINPAVSMNTYQYRCYIAGYCQPSDTSETATLFVNPVITTVAGSTVVCPDTAVVQISVEEFYNVAAFSLTIHYDTNAAVYVDHQNLHPQLQDGNFVANGDQDEVIMSWTSVDPQNIGNAAIIDLLFTSGGGSTALEWDFQTPGSCEYSDLNGHIILSEYEDGSVTVYSEPLVVSHPENKSIEAGENTTFSIAATGTGLSYRWQESTDDGASWTNLNNGGVYSGVTNPVLNLSGVPESMDGYLFRCRVNGTCPPPDTSGYAQLNVTYIPPPQVIYTMFGDVPTSCPGFVTIPVLTEEFEDVGAFSLTFSYDTTVLSYLNHSNLHNALEGGFFFANPSEGKFYMGWASTTAATIGDGKIIDLLFQVQSGNSNLTWDTGTPGNCEYSDVLGNEILSSFTDGSISVYSPPVITSQPSDQTIEEGENTSFNVSANGTELSYQWQLSTDAGVNWTDLENAAPYSGVSTTTLYVSGAAIEMDGNLYRCRVGGVCQMNVVSESALLTVIQIQPPQVIHITAGEVLSSCTGNVYVPVIAEDFNNVAAFSLVLNFNQAILQFDSCQELHPALQGSQLVFNDVDGYLFIGGVSLNPVNIGNDTLFHIYFIGEAGGSSLNWATAIPGYCEFSDISGQVIESTYTSGNVSIVPDPLISDAGADTLVESGEPVTLTGNATGGEPPYSWLWNTGETTQTIIVNPVSTISYSLKVTDNQNCEALDYVIVEVPPEPVVDTVDLQAGWSGISSYVIPQNPAVENIFQPNLTELIILIDPYGKIYWPGQEINTIINWNSHDGYLIKTGGETQVLFSGLEEPLKSVTLSADWNLIPVLSKCDVDVAALFESTSLQIVKEVAGWKVYWPEFNINSLNMLESGRSYYVRMIGSGVIHYPVCESLKSNALSGDDPPDFSPWPLDLPTAKSHTMAITVPAVNTIEINSGDVIGAFDPAGSCFGVVQWKYQNTSLTIFGDDPMTSRKDGFFTGETISFRHYSQTTTKETELIAEYDPSLPDHQGVFAENGLSAIRHLKEDPAGVFSLPGRRIGIFPNPASGKVSVSFYGIDGIVELELSNIHGNILQRHRYDVSENQTTFTIDLSEMPAGIIFFRFIHNDKTIIRKVIKNNTNR